MAIVTEIFSIRGYAERMRSVDLRRSWLFPDEKEDARPLPSIVVRRFKWWIDELDMLRSEEGGEEEDDLNNRAAAEEVISEDDDMSPADRVEASDVLPAGEEARRSGKGKQKGLKKRSMVELFAAAPLIAGVADDGSDGDGSNREEEGGIMDPAIMMKKRTGINEKCMTKKKGRKKKRKQGIREGFKVEIRALGKEKICKPKIRNYIFQNPLRSKNNRKMARSFSEMQKKTRKCKSVRKHEALQTSKLFSLNKEVASKLPVRSILKNQKKSSKTISVKAANLLKFYCESNKHVTFSLKDDILGTCKACSAKNCSQIHNFCKIFSDVLAASSAMNHSSKGHDLVDPNGKSEDANSRDDGINKTEVSSTECKNQPALVNSSNSSCSGTEKASSGVMVDLNHAIEAIDFDGFIPATSTLSSSCTYSGDPTCIVTPQENNQNSTLEILLNASEPVPVPALRENFVASSDTSSLTLLKANERQCLPRVDAEVDFYPQFTDHQSPKDLLSSICYSMGSKNFSKPLFTPDSVGTCKNKCPGEDFIGLPLNSQGEFIQFHSATTFNEAYKRQNNYLGSNGRQNHPEIVRKKVFGAASHHKNYYPTKERERHWLNFTESDSSKRLGIQRNETRTGNDRSLPCNSYSSMHEYRNGPILQPKCNFGYHTRPAVQPTMRLMGKNVVVGGIGRDCHAFSDPRASNRSENLSEQTQFSMFPDCQQWMQRESAPHATIGRLNGNQLQFPNSVPDFYHTKPFKPPLDYTHAHQPPWLSAGITDNHVFKSDTAKHALPSQPFSNNGSHFLGSYFSGQGSMSTESHYRPQNFHQNMLMSSPYCRDNPKIFRRELSTPKPQFKYQNFGQFSQPPLAQPAAKLPQWLLNAKQQNRHQVSCSHCSHLSPHHHTSADVNNNMTAKKNDMNEMCSNLTCFRGPVDTRKLGKRPLRFDDGITNPAKRPLKGKEISSSFQQAANGNGIYSPAAGSSSSRFDNESRSGPIKLIGGAKHILKPCQRIDDENCRPIHSTIIFPSTAASLGPENKFANIYKF